uniref:Uncharacterized protein n=1 Tax=Rhizophagus irregularis (strain DAOM 181602 / DAOM 197198 / MUCL 43194) TaxID=747089 RepID=U9UQD0_RHIID
MVKLTCEKELIILKLKIKITSNVLNKGTKKSVLKKGKEGISVMISVMFLNQQKINPSYLQF